MVVQGKRGRESNLTFIKVLSKDQIVEIAFSGVLCIQGEITFMGLLEMHT